MSRVFLFCFLLLSFLQVSCSSEPVIQPSIRLGYSSHDHHAALYIAAQLPEYFRQQGDLYLKEIEFKQRYQLIEKDKVLAEVLLNSSVGGGQLIRKLHEKQLDIALGGVPAMIQQVDAGSELKIVAPLMSEGAALVLAKDFPANDWKSFVAAVQQAEKPMRIGYKIQTSSQNLIFEQALLTEGIDFSREEETADAHVVVRNLFGAKNLIPALENGLIDGFVVMQPFAAQAEHQAVGKVVARLRDLPPQQQWYDHPCCAIAANGPLRLQQRELLSRLIALLLRANDYLQKHPRESAALVANWLDRPLAVEELSLPTINYLVDYPANWHRGVEFWVTTMEQQGRLRGTLQSAARQGTINGLLYDMEIYEQARRQVVPE